MGVVAQDTVVESIPVPEVAAPVMVYDLAPAPVQINKIDMPRVTEFKSLDRPRLVKKGSPKKSMLLLSRSARNQMALFSIRNASGGSLSLSLIDDQDDGTGLDDLDIHRFFSRPRVVDSDDQTGADESAGISEYVKMRLLMARMKAVEAHALAQMAAVADDGAALPERVTSRLAAARAQAIEIHRRKFS